MNKLNWSKLQEQLKLELCPPGNGVFTIHTAKEKRESLHKKVFGTSEGVEKLWKDSLNNSASAKPRKLITIINC